MHPAIKPSFLTAAMPSTKRSIAEANGVGADEDDHRAAARAPRRRQVSPDGRKPAKPPSASGGAPVDPSSLLILGPDSLSYLLRYFDVSSLARFEGVCKQFRQLAIPRWEALDAQIPAKGRSKAESPRLRVVRYHVAVTACKDIELAISNCDETIGGFFYHTPFPCHCKRIRGRWKLEDSTSINRKNGHKYEYFCRFTRQTDGSLLAQGFADIVFPNDSWGGELGTKEIYLHSFDLSAWKIIKDLNEYLEELNDYLDDDENSPEDVNFGELVETLNEVVDNLAIAVVAVSKDAASTVNFIAAADEPIEDKVFKLTCTSSPVKTWSCFEMKGVLLDQPKSSEGMPIWSSLWHDIRLDGTEDVRMKLRVSVPEKGHVKFL